MIGNLVHSTVIFVAIHSSRVVIGSAEKKTFKRKSLTSVATSDRITTMRRQRRQASAPPAFCQVLKDAGWLLKTAPMAMLAGLGLDEYIYVERADHLVHLHLDPDGPVVVWEAKRYTRETFGDYTTPYQPLGQGVGMESLQQFLESRKVKE
jgi:hypothetical protein